MTQFKITRGFRSFLEVYKPKLGFIICKNQVGSMTLGETVIHFIPLNELPSLFGYLEFNFPI